MYGGSYDYKGSDEAMHRGVSQYGNTISQNVYSKDTLHP